MSELKEAPEVMVDNNVDNKEDDNEEDDDANEPPPPRISNREMEQACGRIEDRLCVLQMYSQDPNKLANTYCCVCRRFLRMKTHNCLGVVDYDFMKKFGGVSILSQEFINKCLDEVKILHEDYQAKVEQDIFWGRDQPAQIEQMSLIPELCAEIDQREVTQPLRNPVEMPLNITVYDSWASRLDFDRYGRPYPMPEDGKFWICFVCFRIHEDKRDGCPFDNFRSIQDRADEQVHLKLDTRISGHKICTEEVRKSFFDYTVEQLAHYRRVRRQDYLLNKEEYNSSVDDTDEDLFLSTDEDEKAWVAKHRQKKKTKKVRKNSSSETKTPDEVKKPRYEDESGSKAQ